MQKKGMELEGLVKSGDVVLAGVSGGADSVCLLLMLLEYRKHCDFFLEAVHVEHGIRGDASRRDAAFVKRLCEKRGICCRIYPVDVPAYAKGHGLGVDVFAFASDQLIDLVDAGVLQAVQDVDTVSSQNVAGAVEAATVDGTLYAYPMSADNGYFLYYDSNVVTDPTNWDAILTDCAAAGKKAGMVLASGWYNAGFFYGAGFTTVLNDDGSTAMDWNGTSADGIKGTDVVDGMLAIATNPAFLPITDGDTANQIATGELGAIVSGTWDAAAVQEAFGDGYAACALPTYTCAGNQVPMGSAAGYKMIGVNANSAQVGWAMELAKFLTNEQSQETRFAERQIGPSNIAAGESDEVKANVAIAAVTAQNGANGVVQIVGSGYWDPSKAFGEIIAQGNPDGTDVQTLLDNLVESASQPTE